MGGSARVWAPCQGGLMERASCSATMMSSCGVGRRAVAKRRRQLRGGLTDRVSCSTTMSSCAEAGGSAAFTGRQGGSGGPCSHGRGAQQGRAQGRAAAAAAPPPARACTASMRPGPALSQVTVGARSCSVGCSRPLRSSGAGRGAGLGVGEPAAGAGSGGQVPQGGGRSRPLPSGGEGRARSLLPLRRHPGSQRRALTPASSRPWSRASRRRGRR